MIMDGLARIAGFAPQPTRDEEAEIDSYLATLRSDGESNPPATKPSPQLFAYIVETGAGWRTIAMLVTRTHSTNSRNAPNVR